MISTPKNSNKFQKTRFWKEKSVEDMVTLGPMAHATLVVIICIFPHITNLSCDKFIIKIIESLFIHTFYTQISRVENMFDTWINVLSNEVQIYE